MGAIPNRLVGFQDWTKDAEVRAKFERAWGVPLEPALRQEPHGDVPRDGARRAARGLRHRREPGAGRGGPASRGAAADRARPPGRAGRHAHPNGRARARGAAGVVELVRGRGHGHQQRAAGAATAQGARAARPGARRHLDHLRDRPAARSRLGSSDGRGDLERGSLAGADLPRDDLRAAGARGWSALAVLRRKASGRAVPPQPPLEGADRRATGPVLGGRARRPGGNAGWRLPVPAHDRTAARLLQHRRADRRLHLAAAPGRIARHLAGGRAAVGHPGRGPGPRDAHAAGAWWLQPASTSPCGRASSS